MFRLVVGEVRVVTYEQIRVRGGRKQGEQLLGRRRLHGHFLPRWGWAPLDCRGYEALKDVFRVATADLPLACTLARVRK